MARTKADVKKKSRAKKKAANGVEKLSPEQAPAFLEAATALLHTGQAEEALKPVTKALACLSQAPLAPHAKLPALELLGETHLELGHPQEARSIFLEAASLDPEATLLEEAGGGADKFLWLAQLSEEGGKDSVDWFEKGCTSLRHDIADWEGKRRTEEQDALVSVLKQKLANALCGAAEVYMTDLSWEEDAEQRCEALVTEACITAPESPEPLQTLASVRISQARMDEARSALTRSMELWSDLPPEDPSIPDFPTRISLCRLLMEAELEDRAIDVLDRLVFEDDSSVEAWYLGGWCLTLMAQKQPPESSTSALATDKDDAEPLKTFQSSRRWLRRSLKLFSAQDYEDDRLQAHALELVTKLNQEIGNEAEDDEDDGAEWIDEDDAEEDQDTHMA